MSVHTQLEADKYWKFLIDQFIDVIRQSFNSMNRNPERIISNHFSGLRLKKVIAEALASLFLLKEMASIGGLPSWGLPGGETHVG